MKKLISVCLCGAVAATAVFGAAACGDSGDVSGKKIGSADINVTTSSVEEATKISDELFGIFLEDINYASYALDDNLIANGNFDALRDTGAQANPSWRWSAVNAEVEYLDFDGVFEEHEEYHNEAVGANVNPYYASVNLTSAGGGISNAGYEAVPMAVAAGEKLDFSAFVKSGTAAKMTVRLTDGQKTYATADIQLDQGGEWIKYKATLTASETGTGGLKFEITFDQTGTYYVDAVALETENSTVGIKNYIYDAIKDLSPKFMRFPGGCIIEGDATNGGKDCVEIYDWKNSIGAVKNGTKAGDDTVPAFTYKVSENGKITETTTYGEWTTRTNNYDLWGYNMDYGLGFYEYFLLCDSIGASPVPIVNCGLSDLGGATPAAGRGIFLNGRHGAKVDDYIADAMDLVAFANGSVNSSDEHEKYWAQIRTNMGHAEPFDMKYIGIGNEQFTSSYVLCYEQFVSAFKEAREKNPDLYGDVQLIVGNGLVFTDCQFAPNSANLANGWATDYKGSGLINKISEYGVVDHHYYMGFADFLHYATPSNCIYDKYSRDEDTRYNVFVGEYSANGATRYYQPRSAQDASRNNTWITALSEAAYMTALERNGDVVSLAAYAPMFGAAKFANQWAVDMMYYTNIQLLRSANYYVQQIFMKNSGSHYLNSVATPADWYEKETSVDGMKFDKFYQAVTYDEKTGDVIVKLVNIDGEPVSANIDLGGIKVQSLADATVLKAGEKGYLSINSLDDTQIAPETFTIGDISSVLGYELPALSVTVIRVHTK